MTTLPRLRNAGRVAVPLGLACGVVGLTAAPALAAVTLTVESAAGSVDGSTVHADTTLRVTGTDTAPDRTGLSKSRTLSLSVNRPDAGEFSLAPDKKVRSSDDGSITGSLDTSCVPWAAGCTQAVNGDYVFTFSDGSTTRTSHVTLQVPPQTPSGFAAGESGTVVTFTWQPNGEPDLVGYDIVDGDGNDVTPGGLDASSVCDSSCSVSVDFGAGARGTSRSFRIVALRRTAPHSAGTVASDPSAAQSVSFPAASPSGSPSDQPAAGGTSGGNGGGSDAGGTGTASHGSTGGGTTGRHGGGSRPPSRHPAADLHATLPTASGAALPSLPTVLTEVKPLPQGSYKPTLAYPDQVQREAIRKPLTAKPTTAVDHLVRVLDTHALWRSLAGAAVLLLLVAHLQAWLRRVDID